MALCLFFELIGLNIGSATLLLVLLGLRGCMRKPLFVRLHPVVADSLDCQWVIVITLEQGLPRPIFQLHRPKGEWVHNLIEYATRIFSFKHSKQCSNAANFTDRHTGSDFSEYMYPYCIVHIIGKPLLSQYGTYSTWSWFYYDYSCIVISGLPYLNHHLCFQKQEKRSRPWTLALESPREQLLILLTILLAASHRPQWFHP